MTTFKLTFRGTVIGTVTLNNITDARSASNLIRSGLRIDPVFVKPAKVTGADAIFATLADAIAEGVDDAPKAKPTVDAFNLDGKLIGTFPSFGKARIAQRASLPVELRDAYAGIGTEGQPLFDAD